MCGIVGVLGNNEVAPLLVEALKRLEYRGYDSAGIATVNHGKLDRRRAVGKLVNLSDLLVHQRRPHRTPIRISQAALRLFITASSKTSVNCGRN
jgi:glutamine---fructose-6-phosphate transaminase (isomerizing)